MNALKVFTYLDMTNDQKAVASSSILYSLLRADSDGDEFHSGTVADVTGCQWLKMFTRALHVSWRLGRGTSLTTMVKWRQSMDLVLWASIIVLCYVSDKTVLGHLLLY